MKNILKNLLGDRAYKQLLKLVGSGGSSDGVSVIKVNVSETFPFITDDDAKVMYTSLIIGEGAVESDIQEYRALIDANIEFANSIIQNYNSDKPTFLSVEEDVGVKIICSVSLVPDRGAISVVDQKGMFCNVPVTFSLDGKVTIKDYPYTVTGK